MSAGGWVARMSAWARWAFALAFCTALHAQVPDALALPANASLRVVRDVRIKPGAWLRAPISDAAHANGTAGVIVAEGLRGVTIDLRGVTLRGASEETPRDQLAGFGIVLRDCENVTVRGGTLGGYRACLVAERCKGLRIEGTQFDGYFAQRLASTVIAANDADQLAPRENDGGEWLARYGAALSLSECAGATVVGCRARHGQNGLLLTRSQRTQVYDNDFSFLSGWGIALFRSSDNVIARNRVDFCVRGYSDGAYANGHASAGLLVFERSCDNLIANNSATHCGIGLALFAGQDLLEGRAAARAEQAAGGSDRNTIARNDFSYSVACGIETAYSSENRVLENLVAGGRQRGFAGTGSTRTLISGNDFTQTRGRALTLVGGKGERVARNVLHACEIGIDLSPGASDERLAERLDTASSRDHWIVGNSFAGNDADLALESSSGLYFGDNVYAAGAQELQVGQLTLHAGEQFAGEPRELLASTAGLFPSGRIERSSLRPLPAGLPAELSPTFELDLPQLPGSGNPLDAGRSPGLERIVVGEWGPWDFESGELRPVARGAGGVLASATWNARWFSWHQGPDPRGSASALEEWRALAEEPLAMAEIGVWISPFGGREDLRRAVGAERIGMIARASVELAPGTYRARTTSDDGVRLRIDSEVAIENWTWHAATQDEALITLAGGQHQFVLEWFQIDGASALTLDLERVDEQR